MKGYKIICGTRRKESLLGVMYSNFEIDYNVPLQITKR